MTTLLRRVIDRLRRVNDFAPDVPMVWAGIGATVVLGPTILWSLLLWGASLLSWGLSRIAPILGRDNQVQQLSFPSTFPSILSIGPTDAILRFAFVVCAYCLGVCTVLLLVAFPVYIFSSSSARSKRAGYVVKVTLGFIITSGTGVMTYLGFGRQPKS